MSFPKSFLWGSATSAYQVEGNNRFSDWWHWEIKNKKEQSGRACDFWNQYPIYIDYLKQGRQNAFRLSLEWARINPEKNIWNEKALRHYLKIIEELKKNKIEPIITLWHFTLPEWLAQKDGWLNKDSLKHWQDYIEKIKEYFGQEIRYWLTLNEPSIYLYKGYLEGNWPPGKKIALFKALRIRRKLIQAHQLAYQILKTKQNQISLALNLSFDEPGFKFYPLGNLLVKIFQNYTDWGVLAELKNKELLDFIGINYYFHNLIKINPLISRKKNKIFSDLGWEIYPQGIAKVAEQVYRLAKKPILITENGLADKKDEKRPKFIQDHILGLDQAMKQGVPIIGYLHWSLIDNFEWALGKEPRFGLLEMDYEKITAKPRQSFWFYKKIVESYTERV
ncbi:MAG: family 1 glycosylhydrolase [Patescibacteria group bacterium]